MTAKEIYTERVMAPWGRGREIPPHPRVQARAELKWVGLDHDGTMFRSTWSAKNPTSDIGEPIWENFIKALDLLDAGYKLIVHTARPSADHEALEAAYDHYGLTISGIVTGKLLAVAYVDDRAVPANHVDWLEAVREIEQEHQ